MKLDGLQALQRLRLSLCGCNPAAKELAEAKHIAALPKKVQRQLPSSLPANPEKLKHINTYGRLPGFYIDQPFQCRDCGKEEIWKAADQKWYYEETKAHMDATAVRCHECRQARKAKQGQGAGDTHRATQ
jgi:hypothetical protein